MSIKSIMFKTGFLLLVTIFAFNRCQADDEEVGVSLKEILYSNLVVLVEKGYLEGELALQGEKLKGELFSQKITGDSLRPNLDSAAISINKDNFECYFLFSTGYKQIEVNLIIAVSEDFLSGFGIISSGANAAMIEMNTEKTKEKYALDIPEKIPNAAPANKANPLYKRASLLSTGSFFFIQSHILNSLFH